MASAGRAFGSVKVRVCRWAVGTFPEREVVNHVVLTENALFFVLIKVFRHKTFNAICCVPILTLNTVTSPVYY